MKTKFQRIFMGTTDLAPKAQKKKEKKKIPEIQKSGCESCSNTLFANAQKCFCDGAT